MPFPKGISPKVSVIAQLDFELADQQFSHNAKGDPTKKSRESDFSNQ